MEVICKFGFRHYLFHSNQDIYKAQEIYTKPLSQDEFELELEKEGIDFCYEIP